MSGDVAGHPLVHNISAAGKGVYEVQGGKEAGLVVDGEKGEQAGAEDADNGSGENDEIPLAVVAYVNGVCESAHDVDRTGWDVEESRSLR